VQIGVVAGHTVKFRSTGMNKTKKKGASAKSWLTNINNKIINGSVD